MPMSTYKHGIYGETKSAMGLANTAQGTVPVYIGTLPVQRASVAEGKAVSEYVNKPFVLSSLRQVNNLGLYSEDWEHYSLCEAIYTHFMNGDSIAPIIVVNMLNPTDKQAESSTTATVNLSKEGTSYIGYINDPLCDISNLAITVPDVTFDTGEVTYAYNGDAVKIIINKAGFTATSVTATYKKLVFTLDDFSTTNFQSALDSLTYIEQITGYIPNILAAPYFSEKPTFHDLMIQLANDKMANKWNFICVSDIPYASADTIANAISWKSTNSYNSKLDKVFWPLATNDGTHIVRLSVVAAYTMQYIDTNNDGIPSVSPSNKVIGFNQICGNTGSPFYVSENEANDLNEVGITTVIPMKGQVRLWGSHMANFSFANLINIADEDKFDVCARMKAYIFNYLQYNHIDEIDESITRKDVDAIINSVQMWLDSLVNEGRLLYANVTLDDETDFANGDIAFSIEVTYPVIAKSITFKLMYTDRGLSILADTETGGEE